MCSFCSPPHPPEGFWPLPLLFHCELNISLVPNLCCRTSVPSFLYLPVYHNHNLQVSKALSLCYSCSQLHLNSFSLWTLNNSAMSAALPYFLEHWELPDLWKWTLYGFENAALKRHILSMFVQQRSPSPLLPCFCLSGFLVKSIMN